MTREDIEADVWIGEQRQQVTALLEERDAALRERDSWRTQCHGEVAAREGEVTALQAQVGQLREALRHIDQLADTQPSYWVGGVIRTALAALSATADAEAWLAEHDCAVRADERAKCDAAWLKAHEDRAREAGAQAADRDARVAAEARARALEEFQAHETPTWPWVVRFAQLMERKLDANRHKGNREGWANDAASALLDRLDQEVAELRLAFERGDIASMPDEAADVANFAMMIADVVGGLDGSLAAQKGAGK